MVGTQLETASLREDYLNQVQRDFLSRRRCRSANTPSEVARTWHGPELIMPCRRQSKTGDSTPSTLCSLVLVVVYCSWTRLSGKT